MTLAVNTANKHDYGVKVSKIASQHIKTSLFILTYLVRLFILENVNINLDDTLNRLLVPNWLHACTSKLKI
jgi:hypothetical protein